MEWNTPPKKESGRIKKVLGMLMCSKLLAQSPTMAPRAEHSMEVITKKYKNDQKCRMLAVVKETAIK